MGLVEKEAYLTLHSIINKNKIKIGLPISWLMLENVQWEIFSLADGLCCSVRA